MNKLFIASLFGLSLIACSDPSSELSKLTPKPAWGEQIGGQIGVGGDCHIDSINDKPWSDAQTITVKQSGPALKVLGWGAVSVREGLLPSYLAVALRGAAGQGNRLFATTTKQKRADVADFFKNPAAADSGFSANISLSDMVPGNYVLEVIQHKDGLNYRCSYTTNIIIEK